VNVSGTEWSGSERSWNKGQIERNEGGIDRMKRNQTDVACMHACSIFGIALRVNYYLFVIESIFARYLGHS